MKFKNLLIFIIFIFNYKIFSQKIFFSSIPKSGTHMLSKCINILTKKNAVPCSDFSETYKLPNIDYNAQFITWHIPYSEKIEDLLLKNQFKCLFLYRDPRDLIISYIFFNIKYIEQIPLQQNQKQYLLDFNDLLVKAIINIKDFYDCYIPWIKSKDVYSIKFEDLVGKQGNGKDELQYLVIENICKHINLKYDNQLIKNCSKSLFGGTFTFREGKIGSWTKYFNENHKNLFKKIAGQLLIDLGYEKDLNW